MKKVNNQEGTFYNSAIDVNNDNESRSIIFSLISNNSNVFDVGCACGDLGIALKNKGCSCFGLEYNPQAIEIAKKTNAYEDIRQADLNNFDTKEFEKYHKSFDYVIFGDVLEHIYNPEDILNDFKAFLKPNGHFIISLPNLSHASIKASLLNNDFTYTKYGLLDETHIRFFTNKTIETMLNKAELEIKKLEYVVFNVQGSQPKVDFERLSFFTKREMYNDEHSFIFQYVLLLKQAEAGVLNKIIPNAAKNYKNLKKMQKKYLAENIKSLFKFKKRMQ